MSERPRVTANSITPLINAQPMATSIIGPPTNINGLPGISYDISWTGTPAGTFQIQISNTYQPTGNGSQTSVGTWITIPSTLFNGTYPFPAGSSGNGFIDVVGTEAAWVRLQYTASTGSGSLTVVPAAKVW